MRMEPLRSIEEILVERDGLSEGEAKQQVEEAKEALQNYLDEDDQESAFDICEEYFGLEPDYLTQLIPGGIF